MLSEMDREIDYLEYDEPETKSVDEYVPVRVVPSKKKATNTVPVRAHERKKAPRKSRKNTKKNQAPEMVVMEGRMVRLHTAIIAVLVTFIVTAVAAAILAWNLFESWQLRIEAVRDNASAQVVEGQK